jgi:hypothetical protein
VLIGQVSFKIHAESFAGLAPPHSFASARRLGEGMSSGCARRTSCESCIQQQPSAGVDFGIRCVWCESEAACREYNKFTHRFPCADALRGGGGYPGGASCAAAARVSVGASRPSLPPQPSYSPFAYRPRTKQPVSVAIPSFTRPGNLHHQLVWLLQLEPLHRRGSEVLN